MIVILPTPDKASAILKYNAVLLQWLEPHDLQVDDVVRLIGGLEWEYEVLSVIDDVTIIANPTRM